MAVAKALEGLRPKHLHILVGVRISKEIEWL